ncbi:MazG nucleotide pyrophosphohydrolase domain-containing protein [Candidatus Hydrogenedentota bacterium]
MEQIDAIKEFSELMDLARLLQAPGGCSWDKKQSLSDWGKCLAEEHLELIEAIEEDDPAMIREEFGDTLFVLLAMAVTCERRGVMDLAGSLAEVREKMVRRHPHVFGDSSADTPEKVLKQWGEIKKTEKGGSQAE